MPCADLGFVGVELDGESRETSLLREADDEEVVRFVDLRRDEDHLWYPLVPGQLPPSCCLPKGILAPCTFVMSPLRGLPIDGHTGRR